MIALHNAYRIHDWKHLRTTFKWGLVRYRADEETWVNLLQGICLT